MLVPDEFDPVAVVVGVALAVAVSEGTCPFCAATSVAAAWV